MKSQILNKPKKLLKNSRKTDYFRLKLFCVLAGLLFISLSFVKGQNYDFRKTTWGMSYKDVKASEVNKTPMTSENRLIYEVTLAGSPFTLVYTFNEKSQLVSARYILDKTYTDHNFYLEEYYKFKELLTKKYGVAQKDALNWTTSTISKDSASWANSLESGYLNLVSGWETSTTLINLSVTKFDLVHLLIDYKAKKFKYYDISAYSTEDL
jgi:hypothetical protein